MEKPTSGDEEQRRAQTRAAREQSGLPPEEGAVAEDGQDAVHDDSRDDAEPAATESAAE
jgi:hypothetical protein